MRRLFLGFKIEDQDGLNLIALVKEKTDQLLDKVHWTPPGHFHVTIHFLQQADPHSILERGMMQRIALHHPIPIVLKKIGLFPRYHSGLLAAYIQANPSLQDVYTTLKLELAQAEVSLENRPYIPHITLGRRFSANFEDITIDYQLTLHSLVLYESQLEIGGSRYIPLATTHMT